LLEIINDSGELPSPDTMQRVILDALNAGSKPSLQLRQVAHFQFLGLSALVLGVRHLDHLAEPKTEPVWEWVRRSEQRHIHPYVSEQSSWGHQAVIGHWFAQPAIADLTMSACLQVLTHLGLALGVTWGLFGLSAPHGEEPPPRVSFNRRWP
jgi:hypothetical protein